MKVQIQRLSNNKETKNNYSLQQWIDEYINQLCLALKLDSKKMFRNILPIMHLNILL